MRAPAFSDFYRACMGYDPFPWQIEAARRMQSGKPPAVVAVPTGLGKTGLIVAWVWALACSKPGRGRSVPLRLVHVSPRRVIVDQTSELIDRITKVLTDPKRQADDSTRDSAAWVAERLLSFTNGEGQPLVSARLRGGVRPEPTWRGRVDQPVAIAATSDLAGSGFLFRHFTSSSSAWPVIAGLLGVDACWILDEGHLQEPLRLTLERCRQAERNSPLELPWWLIQTTATPRAGNDVLGLSDEDRRHPVVQKRLRVRRLVQLHEGVRDNAGAKKLAELAENAANRGARAVLVVADTVERARQCWQELQKRCVDSAGTGRVLLLHGQQREWDRREVLRQAEDAFSMREPPLDDGPVCFLVTTNAIEVGADLSADHLVTIACPADSLLQRLGRLGRRADKNEYGCDVVVIAKTKGESAVTPQEQIASARRRKKKTETLQDRVEKATSGTVEYLRGRLKDGSDSIAVETGALGDLTRADLAAPSAPPMPISANALWALVRTRPAPVDTPDVSALIHGIGDRDDSAYLAWRDDLPEDKNLWRRLLESWPLRPHETLSLPAWALRDWLLGNDSPKGPFLVWEEGRRARLVDHRRAEASISPGTVVVVPSRYGGHDGYGFCPSAEDPVVDLADLANDHPKGPRLRLREDRLPEHLASELVKLLAAIQDPDTADEVVDKMVREVLRSVANDGGSDQIMQEAAARLVESREIEWELREEGIAVVARSRTVEDEDELCLTSEIGLDEHQQDVAQRAAAMACRSGVAPYYKKAVRLGGLLHDKGKADEQFQTSLRWGRKHTPAAPLLAKSGLPRRKWKQASYEAGVPKQFRHEAISDALAALVSCELVAHLAGSSHGWGRPWYPVVATPGTGTVEITFEGRTVSVQGNPLQEGVPEGRAERFERLNVELGPWSLAWLEATVRLADQAASAGKGEAS